MVPVPATVVKRVRSCGRQMFDPTSVCHTFAIDKSRCTEPQQRFVTILTADRINARETAPAIHCSTERLSDQRRRC